MITDVNNNILYIIYRYSSCIAFLHSTLFLFVVFESISAIYWISTVETVGMLI